MLLNISPVISAPGELTAVQNLPLVISSATGNGIVVSDVDADGGAEEVTLSVSHGTLTLGFNPNLAFENGTGLVGRNTDFTGTISDIQAAVDGMIYTPDPGYAGTDSLSITVNDLGHTGGGGPMTASASVSITVLPALVVNMPPIVSAGEATLAYIEGQGGVAIAQNLIVSDFDSATLADATVTLIGYVAGQDLLGFTNQNGITGTWNSSTGVLSLSGNASPAQYQAALASVTYTNSSFDPSTAPRVARFVANDGRARQFAGRCEHQRDRCR